MTQPWQHIRIPFSILEFPELKSATIATYVALASFADIEGKAWPSIKTLAHRSKVSQATVRKEIERLQSFGLLVVHPRIKIVNGKPMSSSHLYLLPWHKKYLTNNSNDSQVSDADQGEGKRDTTPTHKRDSRTTTKINHNQVNQRAERKRADELVARIWSPRGSTQSQRDISSIIELSLRNGIPYEKLEVALNFLAKEGSYISKFSLAQALSPRSKLKGKLQADLPVNWDEESEKL